MNNLENDFSTIEELVTMFADYASKYLVDSENRPAASGICSPQKAPTINIDEGIGAGPAFEHFKELFVDQLSGSTGPNYFGFVTGGVTPAGLIGDWLTALFDQNAMGSSDSIAAGIELRACNMFCELLGLSNDYTGSFVTGATMSSFVGLSTARQWVSKQRGMDAAQHGLYGMAPIKVLSGTPHSSILKGMSMSGLGRENLIPVATLSGREAVDISALNDTLGALEGPTIVVANSGTVNTVDFDDLNAISELKKKHNFWLHVDAAFGGVAACSETYGYLVDGLNNADSITIDAHKWLNVPYDCAVQLSRHIDVQREVFQNSASYLASSAVETNYVDLTPENSRRLRAISIWMSIVAYGKDGYAEMIERNVECAKEFGKLVDQDTDFELLAPVKLNGVCFTLSNSRDDKSLAERVSTLLKSIQEDGTYFLTGTNYAGSAGLRFNASNWQSKPEHARCCFDKLKTLLN